MTGFPLSGDTTVCDLLSRYPRAFSVFEAHGMCEDCKAAPPPVPLHHFSQKHGVPLDQLIGELSEVIAAGT
ncbi:MAG: hypothetical protein JSV91_12555 [Phycisphaerales bacterium]|nr:MAG: hypothetical protein JSV91_12555 [Phycisphaerales bacterium]